MKDRYIDLATHAGIRVRVDHLDGNWSGSREVWWDRELISFMSKASPDVPGIVEAEHKIREALKDLACSGMVDGNAPNLRGDVIMLHRVHGGTFVKIDVWCSPGTGTRLGIKGYGPAWARKEDPHDA